MKYENRKLSEVSVWAMNIQVHPDTVSVNSTVQLQITNQDGDDHGPLIRAELSTAVASSDPTLREAEKAMIASAYELIQRVAKEPLEALLEKFEDGRAKENFFAKVP